MRNFMKIVLLFTTMIIFVACGNKSESQNQELQVDTTQNQETVNSEIQKETQTEKTFKIERFDYRNLGQFDISGDVINGLKWYDANGENYFIVTLSDVVEREDKDAEMFFESQKFNYYHYNDKSGDFALLNDGEDGIEDCDFDLMIDLFQDDLQVLDKDKDNIGEVYFGYKKTCTSDVSPFELVLWIIEGENFTRITGTTIVDYGGEEKAGGDIAYDQTFNDFDAKIQEHAEKLYKKLQKK